MKTKIAYKKDFQKLDQKYISLPIDNTLTIWEHKAWTFRLNTVR